MRNEVGSRSAPANQAWVARISLSLRPAPSIARVAERPTSEDLHASPSPAWTGSVRIDPQVPTAKLVANVALFSVLAALGEAVAVGRSLGVTNDVLFDVLDATPLGDQARRRRQMIESGDRPPTTCRTKPPGPRPRMVASPIPAANAHPIWPRQIPRQ
jgi:hypothetical protein